ncbi:MAG: malate dehydrogenase [Selenomonas sp.]|jgi:malate dehydrogenase|nr:malate dehydrogenase [Selenomonas sp.]MCI7330663.1 malate dehydrogenase [Selenomonadaceae bacterium]MDD7055268.1 malate dehydrogenase [Selenomonadaceae bacterium]MDY3917297.1 malate dehydrogenase [Selenomonadaceae bacterium]
MKVTVVGAGNVGATVANVLAQKKFCSEVVLVDIKDGVPQGKAMDIMQTAHMLNFNTRVVGVTAQPGDENGYAPTAGSEVVVVTSGIPRKPGMTREQLIGTNAKIVKSVVDQAMKFSPDAYFIIISNPMDSMTYLTLKDTKLPRNRVIGQGGMLDSSRFRYFLAQALTKAGYPASVTDVDGMVIGGHNDKTMVPLVSLATWRGVPVTDLLSKEALDDVVAQTKVGGATLTGLLGTSAWIAPGAAAAALVEAIAMDEKKLIPCCVSLEGEYGEKDLCIGVPVVLGAKGVEKVVELKLAGEEKEKFEASVQAARDTNAKLGEALK